MSTLYEHTLLKDLRHLWKFIGKPISVIDVGPGLRPATWANAKRHVCIEPCNLYAERLRANGFEVIEDRAVPGLRQASKADLVLMLDVIEHMDKDEGREALELAVNKGRRVIVYTPNGFVEQESDSWGCGQDEFQRHRSGWTPDEFPRWTILTGPEGFAAIYDY